MYKKYTSVNSQYFQRLPALSCDVHKQPRSMYIRTPFTTLFPIITADAILCGVHSGHQRDSRHGETFKHRSPVNMH